MNDFPKNESSQAETTSRVPKEQKLKLLHKKGLYTLEAVDSTEDYDAYEYDKDTQTTIYYRYVYPEISDDDYLKLSWGKEVDLGIPKCTKQLQESTKALYTTPKAKSETKSKSNAKHQRQTNFYKLYSGPSIDEKALRTIGISLLFIGILGAVGSIALCFILESPFYIIDGIVLFISGLVTYLVFNSVANISNKTNAIISYLASEQRNQE